MIQRYGVFKQFFRNILTDLDPRVHFVGETLQMLNLIFGVSSLLMSNTFDESVERVTEQIDKRRINERLCERTALLFESGELDLCFVGEQFLDIVQIPQACRISVLLPLLQYFAQFNVDLSVGG